MDRELGWMMIHAGLAPKWTTALAEKHAREVERQLHGDGYRKLFQQHVRRQAQLVAATGRQRPLRARSSTSSPACATARRAGAWRSRRKARPARRRQGLYPWYEVPGRAQRDLKIVCGHWSTLGLMIGHGVHAIDTGAVWGGKLTALQLDTDELRLVQVARARRAGATTQGASAVARAAAGPQPGDATVIGVIVAVARARRRPRPRRKPCGAPLRRARTVDHAW